MSVPASMLAENARNHLSRSSEVKKLTSEKCVEEILAAVELIVDSFRSGGKVLLIGNGGSAGDCQHLAAEFVKSLRHDCERPGLPAIALTTDTSFLTAYANDCSFEGIFERQVSTLGRPGDLLIAISTSGNSPNIIRAVEAADAAGMKSVALTGTEGRLRELVSISIGIPSTDTQYIQEAHAAVEHILCDLVERVLFSHSGDLPK